MNKNKYVIVTMQRSGSNMLGSILDSHPQIACFGELMRRTPDWMLEKGYRGALKILEVTDPEFRDDNVRFARPYDFVNCAFSTQTKKNIKGFKLHVEQHPEFLEKLFGDPEYSFIHLQRENVLAQYSSWKIAQVTGQGNARKGTEIRRAKVLFKPTDFQKYLNRIEKDLSRITSMLSARDDSVFHIKYTQLMNDAKIREVIAFLGADDKAAVEVGTEKRNPSNILSRFENPEIVTSFLESIGRSDWSREQTES